MRLIFVTQYDPLDLAAGGPVNKVRALSSHLAGRGHSVTIISSRANRRNNYHNLSNLYEEEPGVTVIRLRATCRYRSTSINPWIWPVARREVKHADLVHLFGFYDLLGPVAACVARSHKIPYVIEPIGMLVPIVRSLGKKMLYHRLLGSRLVAGASRVLATSPQEKSELLEAGIPSSTIVERRNGIDLGEFAELPRRGDLRQRLGIASDERVILYLSRLSTKKNPDMLLRVFRDLNIPDTRLVIAGPDEDGSLKRLQSLAESLGLGEKTLFTGALYGRDKLSAFVDADLFVLPSRNENFGNVVAESIASGTPVVITDQCGIAPCVRDKAGLVVPVEQKALGDAIFTLLTEPDLYRVFKDGCSEVARGLSWAEPVEELESIYQVCCAQ